MDTLEYPIDPLSLPGLENQNPSNYSGFESALENNNTDSEYSDNDSVITNNESDSVIIDNEPDSVITANDSESDLEDIRALYYNDSDSKNEELDNPNSYINAFREVFNAPNPIGLRINANGFLNLRRPMMRTDFSLVDSSEVSIPTTSTPYSITNYSFDGNSWVTNNITNSEVTSNITNSLVELTENPVSLEDSITCITTLIALYI